LEVGVSCREIYVKKEGEENVDEGLHMDWVLHGLGVFLNMWAESTLAGLDHVGIKWAHNVIY
jgi:hypothetical protein